MDTWAQLLAELQRTGRRLEDVPAAVVRPALKKNIPGSRSILPPPPLIRAAFVAGRQSLPLLDTGPP